MLKEEFVKEEYEMYLESIKYITTAIKAEHGTRAIPGYVLLNKDKQPKQRMNCNMFPITSEQEIAKYNRMSVVPSDIEVRGGNKLYKRILGDFWGKHTTESILDMFQKKELTDLNAMGTGKFFQVVDIDTKNIKEGSPSLEKIESLLPKTLIVKTPSGGKHYYFLVKKGSVAPASTTLPCIDILGKGKLVVAPGQEREGKGHYELDTSNPNFSYEMAVWSESIRSSLSSLFSSPIGYLDTSSVSQEKASVSRKPCVPESSPKFIKESVKLALKGGSKIEEGMRNRAVFDYCSLIADRTPVSELLTKALDFNKKFLVKPLPVREVEGVVKSCIRSFSCYARLSSPAQAGQDHTGKSNEQSKADTSKFQNLHNQLQSILSRIEKTEEFTGKIEDIAPAIQSFFEAKFGKAYSRAIPTSEVGKILRAAGFEKKKIQVNGVRAWVWNFDQKTIRSLEAVVEALRAPAEAAVKVEATSSIQVVSINCSTSEELGDAAKDQMQVLEEFCARFSGVLRDGVLRGNPITSFGFVSGLSETRQPVQTVL